MEKIRKPKKFLLPGQIPEIDIHFRPVEVGNRGLRAQWHPEMVQDLQMYHGIDAEAELTAVLTDEIRREIDQNILMDLGVRAINNPIPGPANTEVNYHNIEVPRTNRFMFEFPHHFEIPSYRVRSCSRMTYQALNGRGIWDDITLIVDGTTPIDWNNLMNVGEDGLIYNITNTFYLSLIANDGTVYSKYRIDGVVTSYSMNALNFQDDGIVEYEVTIRPNYVVLMY